MPTPLEGKRILVVEDHPVIAEMLCSALRNAGAAPVGPAATSDDAINLAARETLDGVLLDVELQQSNGVKVAEYLRARRVPFVLLTGYDEASLHPELRGAPYLGKPTLPSELLEKAVAAFAGKRDESK
jgi:CheY-like chemotaxis protein